MPSHTSAPPAAATPTRSITTKPPPQTGKNFSTPGLHILLTLPANPGPRGPDITNASAALVGELQTLIRGWRDPTDEWSQAVHSYATRTAANDDLESIQYYRDQGQHTDGRVSVAITLGTVGATTITFAACINEALQTWVDKSGDHLWYQPMDGFWRHVVDVTVVRAKGARHGWLVANTKPRPGDPKLARTCINY